MYPEAVESACPSSSARIDDRPEQGGARLAGLIVVVEDSDVSKSVGFAFKCGSEVFGDIAIVNFPRPDRVGLRILRKAEPSPRGPVSMTRRKRVWERHD